MRVDQFIPRSPLQAVSFAEVGLVGFRRLAVRPPSVVLPVFSSGSAGQDGLLYQRANDIGQIATFVRDPDLTVDHILLYKGAPKTVRAGEAVIHAFELANGVVLCGGDPLFSEQLSEILHQGQLADFPFIALEVASFVRAPEIQSKYTVRCAQVLAETSVKIATAWATKSNLTKLDRLAVSEIIERISKQEKTRQRASNRNNEPVYKAEPDLAESQQLLDDENVKVSEADDTLTVPELLSKARRIGQGLKEFGLANVVPDALLMFLDSENFSASTRWKDLFRRRSYELRVSDTEDQFISVLVQALMPVSEHHRRTRRMEASIVLMSAVVELNRYIVTRHPERIAGLAGNLSLLARALADVKQFDAAEKLFREAIEIRSVLDLGDDATSSAAYARALVDLALCLQEIGSKHEAIRQLDAAVSVQRRLVQEYGSKFSSDLMGSLASLCRVLTHTGQLSEARRVAEDILAMDRKWSTRQQTRAYALSVIVALNRTAEDDVAEAWARCLQIEVLAQSNPNDKRPASRLIRAVREFQRRTRSWFVHSPHKEEIFRLVHRFVEDMARHPNASTVYPVLLDIDAIRPMVMEGIRKWLVGNGTTRSAWQMYIALLRNDDSFSGESPELVRWFAEHGSSELTAEFLGEWLKAIGPGRGLTPHMLRWFDSNNESLRAGQLYIAFLRAEGEKNFIGPRLQHWLVHHSRVLLARDVMIAWLYADGPTALIEPAMLDWCREHGASSDALKLYEQWLDKGGDPRLIKKHLLGWISTNDLLGGARPLIDILAKSINRLHGLPGNLITLLRHEEPYRAAQQLYRFAFGGET